MQVQCVGVEHRSTLSAVSKTSTEGKSAGTLVSASGSAGAVVDLVFSGGEVVELTRDGRVRVKVDDAGDFEKGRHFELMLVEIEEPAEAAATPPAETPVKTETPQETAPAA